MTLTSPITRRDRLRRVIILCCRFGRNLAYYRVGHSLEYRSLLDPKKTNCANFWITANSNFLDVCVLEWCKLLADKDEQHHWKRIVTNPIGFKISLLDDLKLDEAEFKEYINVMRAYRDRFVAHLDSENIMKIPKLDVAKKAVGSITAIL